VHVPAGPRHRWEDNIKISFRFRRLMCDVNWIQLVLDSVRTAHGIKISGSIKDGVSWVAK
jgi:hypothetical protein